MIVRHPVVRRPASHMPHRPHLPHRHHRGERVPGSGGIRRVKQPKRVDEGTGGDGAGRGGAEGVLRGEVGGRHASLQRRRRSSSGSSGGGAACHRQCGEGVDGGVSAGSGANGVHVVGTHHLNLGHGHVAARLRRHRSVHAEGERRRHAGGVEPHAMDGRRRGERRREPTNRGGDRDAEGIDRYPRNLGDGVVDASGGGVLPPTLRGGVAHDVEEAGAAFALVEVVLADEVLLSVAGDLRGGAGLHEMARDAAPVSLAELLKTEQEETVLLLCPRDAFLALARRSDGRVRQVAILVDGLHGLHILLDFVRGLRLAQA
mmetsp:Transcript_26819/g.65717  ORF Transcript_26819/g.65717 Transcript_26819/m.65717 type:complete len:317 (-) Transcript_26819:316-1266(-)